MGISLGEYLCSLSSLGQYSVNKHQPCSYVQVKNLTLTPALSPHPFYSPSTQGSIIHSTVVGAGPCLSCSVVTMCCEARSSRNRKVR